MSSADKKVMVFRGIATLLRLRWSPWRRTIGLTLLQAGVLLRAVGDRVRLARSSAGTDDLFWQRVWADRSRWLPGYPPRDMLEDASE